MESQESDRYKVVRLSSIVRMTRQSKRPSKYKLLFDRAKTMTEEDAIIIGTLTQREQALFRTTMSYSMRIGKIPKISVHTAEDGSIFICLRKSKK